LIYVFFFLVPAYSDQVRCEDPASINDGYSYSDEAIYGKVDGGFFTKLANFHTFIQEEKLDVNAVWILLSNCHPRTIVDPNYEYSDSNG
jgi:hypothetical protein